MQETASNPRPIAWYRSPLDKKEHKSLHERSDWRGAVQTLGYLGLLVLTGSAALLAAGRLPIGVVLFFVFLHGTICAFHINAVHELGHGTVFKTKFLNAFFVRIFAFFGWINFEMFNTSHARHHRYTLHQPDDLEVILPMKLIIREFLVRGIFNPRGLYEPILATIRIARAKFEGPWEQALFPEGSAERKAAVNWARTMLAGHALILAVSIYFHLWVLPFLTTFAQAYGGWLQGLLNNTQHIGLQDDVSDFRLCCRTFTVNPMLQFVYWHMNYHIEHHMYAAIPCYNLGRLHRAIERDLPPCPHGVIATWKEIAAILKIQEADPTYQHQVPLPGGSRVAPEGTVAALA